MNFTIITIRLRIQFLRKKTETILGSLNSLRYVASSSAKFRSFIDLFFVFILMFFKYTYVHHIRVGTKSKQHWHVLMKINSKSLTSKKEKNTLKSTFDGLKTDYKKYLHLVNWAMII